MSASDKKVHPVTSSARNALSKMSFNLRKTDSNVPALVSQASNMDNKLRKIADSLDPSSVEFHEDKNGIEAFRVSLKDFLHHNTFGLAYNFAMLCLSVISCFQFIYSLYLPSIQGTIVNYIQASMRLFDICVVSAFTFDWALNLFIAEHHYNFLVSFDSIVDIMTAVSVFSTVNVHNCPAFSMHMNIHEIVLYILCGMVVTRILRVLRVRSRFVLIEDEVQRALANIGLNVTVMILYNSALMEYFETQQELEFHTWTYFLLVTISTVGYGDITAKTILGRFLAMFIIAFAIITIPQMTNDLIAKISAQSFYARTRYIAKTGHSQHVLICGDVKSSSIREFFEELFHEDHDVQNLHAVILQPGLPSREILNLLKDPRYELLVSYLEGSPLVDKDLNRASAERAKAVFLMTNKFSPIPDEEDAKIILQQFSIQRYLRLYSSYSTTKKSLFCMQLIRPENKRHLVTAGNGPSNNSDEDGGYRENLNLVVCLNEIKMGVIAKAVIYPGANTLILNLLSSFADDETPSGANQMKRVEGIETLEEDESSSDWIGEYSRGCDWEIYTTELSSSFVGQTFCNLSEVLYQKLGILLFGLEIEELRSKDRNASAKVLLNPANYIIPPKEEARITGFVMAKNKAQSDLSFSKNNDDDGNAFNGQNFNQLSLLSSALSHRLTVMQKPVNTNANAAVHDDEKDPRGNHRNGRGPKEKLAWQALLRRHETEKSFETIQEELQKQEDSHLHRNYFVRDYVMELHDAHIRTSIMAEKPFVENHILVIGKALSNLYDLIRPLRAKTLGMLRHIVILYPGDFPVAVWQRISIFESIWIVRGSSLEEGDIRRCGIFKAKQVVLLADASAIAESARGSADLDALVDADAIFCYQAVRRMNEHAHVVVEIVRQTNVAYLNPEIGLNSSDIDYKFTPQFASGALFTTSLLDTLVCQAFYNTKVVEVINKLVGSAEVSPGSDNKSGGQNSLTPPSSPSKPTGSNNKTQYQGSALYQIPVLIEGLESRTYGALFTLLAKRKQIPLGILRGVFSNTKSGPKANKMPYVFTNPPRDTELFSCDKVFVLSPTPVRARSGGKEESTEIHQDVHTQLRARKTTTEDIVNMLSTLTEQVETQRAAQQGIERGLERLAEEMHHRFASLQFALEGGGGRSGAVTFSEDNLMSPSNNLGGSASRSTSRRPSMMMMMPGTNPAANNNLSLIPPPLMSPPMRRPMSAAAAGGGGGSAASRARSPSNSRRNSNASPVTFSSATPLGSPTKNIRKKGST